MNYNYGIAAISNYRDNHTIPPPICMFNDYYVI